MATNEVTIEALQRLNKLLKERCVDPEILAYNRLLKNHLRRQSGLNPTKHRGHHYEYDPVLTKLIRVKNSLRQRVWEQGFGNAGESHD